MNPGIQLKIIYSDDDLLLVRVRCSNGGFSGETQIYTGLNELEHIAKLLRGFPETINDIREVQLGSFDPKCAGGGVRLRFYCINSAGRTSVETTIESSPERSTGCFFGMSKFNISFEPAAIDLFLPALEHIGAEKQGVAFLGGLTTG
jgi:hypothetical protein